MCGIESREREGGRGGGGLLVEGVRHNASVLRSLHCDEEGRPLTQHTAHPV